MGCRGLPARRAAVLVVLLREIRPHRACGQFVVVLRNWNRPPLISATEYLVELAFFESERRLTLNSRECRTAAEFCHAEVRAACEGRPVEVRAACEARPDEARPDCEARPAEVRVAFEFGSVKVRVAFESGIRKVHDFVECGFMEIERAVAPQLVVIHRLPHDGFSGFVFPFLAQSVVHDGEDGGFHGLVGVAGPGKTRRRLAILVEGIRLAIGTQVATQDVHHALPVSAPVGVRDVHQRVDARDARGGLVGAQLVDGILYLRVDDAVLLAFSARLACCRSWYLITR